MFALFKFFVLLKDYKKKPVINSCGFLPDFFTLLVKLPVISIVRSQILLEYKIRHPKLFVIISRLHILSLKRKVHLIAVSNAVATHLKFLGLDSSAISVIHNSYVTSKNKNKIELTTGDPLRFLYVGHFDVLKNVSELVSFWLKAKKNLEKISLAGNWNKNLSSLKNQAMSNDSIHFFRFC